MCNRYRCLLVRQQGWDTGETGGTTRCKRRAGKKAARLNWLIRHEPDLAAVVLPGTKFYAVPPPPMCGCYRGGNIKCNDNRDCNVLDVWQ